MICLLLLGKILYSLLVDGFSCPVVATISPSLDCNDQLWVSLSLNVKLCPLDGSVKYVFLATYVFEDQMTIKISSLIFQNISAETRLHILNKKEKKHKLGLS